MTTWLAPGATSVSALAVYHSVAPDGIAGGSPHLHTVASEAYLVTGGRGELHVIDADGFRSVPLATGDTVRIEPGVVHRAVNRGGLEVRVLMSHAGLPEAGDAVLTFPDRILADPERYAAAAYIPGPEASHAHRLEAAERRRDLAVEGYRALFAETAEGFRVNPEAVAHLHERAVALVGPRIERWRGLAADAVERVAQETRERLDALAQADARVLDGGRAVASQPRQDYGMCGILMREHSISGGQR